MVDVVCQQCLYSAHTQHTTRLPVVSMVHARFCIVTSSCVMCVVCTLDIHVEIEILFNLTLSILPQKRHHSSLLQSTQSAKLNFVGTWQCNPRIYTRNRLSHAFHSQITIQVN